MASPRKTSASTKTEFVPLAPIGTCEIAPGLFFPLKRMCTLEGWNEAIRLKAEWMRENGDPLLNIQPETQRVSSPISYFTLDAQKVICIVTKLITQRASCILRYGDHPEAPPVLVKRAREILHRDLKARLREFVNELISDVYFETYLSLEGEVMSASSRAEVKKSWAKSIADRADKKRRRIMAREGLFPTPYLLQAALREAMKAILVSD